MMCARFEFEDLDEVASINTIREVKPQRKTVLAYRELAPPPCLPPGMTAVVIISMPEVVNNDVCG